VHAALGCGLAQDLWIHRVRSLRLTNQAYVQLAVGVSIWVSMAPRNPRSDTAV
jgi:hypothetical protein